MMRTICAILLLVQLALPGYSRAAAAFGGVGIDGVPRADGTIAVRQLVAGGPAHLAGIQPGDIITQVDGTPTAGSDFRFIVERRLRGRAGTPVLILVRRSGNPKTLSFKMVRRQLSVAGNSKKDHKGE